MPLYWLSLIVVLLTCSAVGQKPIPRGVRQADKATIEAEKNIPPPTNSRPEHKLAEVRLDARELAQLAQTIPADVDQTIHGVLPKDLVGKLRKIEKLSRKLRNRLSQ